MPDDGLQRAVTFTLINKGSHEWIVEPSDGREMGPYYNAATALQVAALEVFSARKRDLQANIFVRDDDGHAHRCELVDKTNSTDHCFACEGSWSKVSRPLPPRCPLWEAFGGR